jgi:mono/diheme cytochrome c family protein
MRRIITVFFIATAVMMALVLTNQSSQAREDKKGPDGKTLFTDKKCNGCHGLEAAGITKKTKGGPPDLSTVGSKHDAAWIQKWLNKEESLNGKKHMMKFSGTPEELTTLSTWLGSFKEKEKK